MGEEGKEACGSEGEDGGGAAQRPFLGYADPAGSPGDSQLNLEVKRETYVGADPIIFESSIDDAGPYN